MKKKQKTLGRTKTCPTQEKDWEIPNKLPTGSPGGWELKKKWQAQLSSNLTPFLYCLKFI